MINKILSEEFVRVKAFCARFLEPSLKIKRRTPSKTQLGATGSWPRMAALTLLLLLVHSDPEERFFHGGRTMGTKGKKFCGREDPTGRTPGRAVWSCGMPLTKRPHAPPSPLPTHWAGGPVPRASRGSFPGGGHLLRVPTLQGPLCPLTSASGRGAEIVSTYCPSVSKPLKSWKQFLPEHLPELLQQQRTPCFKATAPKEGIWLKRDCMYEGLLPGINDDRRVSLPPSKILKWRK